MEKLRVHQKQIKHSKSNKKPFKVVYISNPMKFITRADQFRAVVQELTGRDSNIVDLEDRAAKFPMITQLNGQSTDLATETCQPEHESIQAAGSYSYDDFDAMFEMSSEKFAPELFENFSTLHHYEPCLEANLGEV
ncbi:hypothetical protein LUZ60_013237 [Juncus effusus]|nr:hypothetical protein LUZ60_013237 [Juncus effusus]